MTLWMVFLLFCVFYLSNIVFLWIWALGVPIRRRSHIISASVGTALDVVFLLFLYLSRSQPWSAPAPPLLVIGMPLLFGISIALQWAETKRDLRSAQTSSSLRQQ